MVCNDFILHSIVEYHAKIHARFDQKFVSLKFNAWHYSQRKSNVARIIERVKQNGIWEKSSLQISELHPSA